MILSKFEFNITFIYKYLHRYYAQLSDIKKKMDYIFDQNFMYMQHGQNHMKRCSKIIYFQLYFYITQFL